MKTKNEIFLGIQYEKSATAGVFAFVKCGTANIVVGVGVDRDEAMWNAWNTYPLWCEKVRG